MNWTDVDGIFALTASLSKAKKYIYLYYTPFLFLGVFGNIFALVLLLKRGRRLSLHLVPMIFIAFGDCGTLLTALIFDRFMTEGVGVPSFAISSLSSCKTISYFWGVFNSLSVNIICIVAIDRFLALSYPIWHRTITRKKMSTLCISFTIAVAFLSIPLPIYWINIKEYQACYIMPSLPLSSSVALQAFINLFYNGIISSALLCIFDIIISKSLLTRSLNREIKSVDRKSAANLLVMAAAFLLATVPRCIAFTTSLVYGYFVFDFARSMLFLEVAKILDALFYTYCAFNWCFYVVRFKLINMRTQVATFNQSTGNG